MARKTTVNDPQHKLNANHGHLFSEDANGKIITGWCVGDQPWKVPYPWPLGDDEGHLLMDEFSECPHKGQHDPVKIV